MRDGGGRVAERGLVAGTSGGVETAAKLEAPAGRRGGIETRTDSSPLVFHAAGQGVVSSQRFEHPG